MATQWVLGVILDLVAGKRIKSLATRVTTLEYASPHFTLASKKSVMTWYAPVALWWKLMLCDAFGCRYGTKGFALR
jgi:hypothetical protein